MADYETNLARYLEKHRLSLPLASASLGSYCPAATTGSLVFLSGQLPIVDGKIITGTAGATHNTPQAKEAALHAGLMIIAQLKKYLKSNDANNDGELQRIRRIVRLDGFVAAAPNFKEHPAVINGASDLMLEVFNEAGIHARTAVGVASLPNGAMVEISAVVEIRRVKL